MKPKSVGSENRGSLYNPKNERVVILIRLFVVAISLYIAYYTASYMIHIIKNEKNVFAGIFIGVLAVAVAVLPFIIKL